jgi:hypothetical protein
LSGSSSWETLPEEPGAGGDDSKSEKEAGQARKGSQRGQK